MTEKKRGRPPHKSTEETRELVEMLAGFGIPHDKIAKAIRITIPTLELHYRQELNDGRARVEAELVGNLMRLSRGKDATALRATMFALQCHFGWSQYAPAPVDVTPEEKLGKKERQQLEAQTVPDNTDWAKLLN